MTGNINLITTIIGFGMCSTFIVFVCTRIIICGRIRVADPSRTTTGTETDIEQPEQRNDALEPAVVAAIPTMKYHRDAFGPDEDTQCSICLGEYQEKEVLRIIPKCGHSFHLSCIDPWLMKQSTCPVCRLPVRNSIDQKHSSVSLSSDHGAEILVTQSIGNAGNQQAESPLNISEPRLVL